MCSWYSVFVFNCYVGFCITLPIYFLHLSWVCELIRIIVDVVPGDTLMCYIGWLYIIHLYLINIVVKGHNLQLQVWIESDITVNLLFAAGLYSKGCVYPPEHPLYQNLFQTSTVVHCSTLFIKDTSKPKTVCQSPNVSIKERLLSILHHIKRHYCSFLSAVIK